MIFQHRFELLLNIATDY